MSRAKRIAVITLWTLTAVMGQAQAPRTVAKTTITAKA